VDGGGSPIAGLASEELVELGAVTAHTPIAAGGLVELGAIAGVVAGDDPLALPVDRSSPRRWRSRRGSGWCPCTVDPGSAALYVRRRCEIGAARAAEAGWSGRVALLRGQGQARVRCTGRYSGFSELSETAPCRTRSA